MREVRTKISTLILMIEVGDTMSKFLFGKYGGVDTLTPLVRKFYKRIMTTCDLL